MPRRREWKNQAVVIAQAAAAQTATEIGTGQTVKGATVVRSLVELAISPVTVNVDVIFTFALWVGPAGGEPGNIDVADTASYLYWNSFVHNLSTAVGTGATERFFRKSIDVRGQRVFRSDFDGLWLLTRASGASALSVYIGTRTLYLAP